MTRVSQHKLNCALFCLGQTETYHIRPEFLMSHVKKFHSAKLIREEAIQAIQNYNFKALREYFLKTYNFEIGPKP